MNLSNSKSSGGSGALLWIVIAGAIILVGGFLIGTLAPQSLPTSGSAQAQQVDALFQFMLVIGGAIFLLVQGVLLYSVIRYRARPGDQSDGPAIHGNTMLEFIWTVIPAVIVTAITLYSWQVWTSTRAIQPNEYVAGVVGARFAWTFDYFTPQESLPADVVVDELDANVQAGLAANNGIGFSYPQLHTWVGQPVKLDMRTQDVIHSFWVPGMRIKQDLLPGRTTEIRFTPVEAGVYRIVCAELCGSGHGAMAGEVGSNGELLGAWLVVHPDEATYRHEFYEPELRAVLFPPEDPALRGRQLLASGAYPCATCHVLSDLNWQGNIGPSLNGIGARTARLNATGEPDMATYLHDSIRHPQAYLVPGYGPLMPQFNPEPDQPNYMPESDLEAIVAYLLTQTGE